MQSNQRLILSQGGRHGRHAKTYLPGKNMPHAASRHVPNRYLSGNSANEFVTSRENIKTKTVKPKENPFVSLEDAEKAKAAVKLVPKNPVQPPPAPPAPPAALSEGKPTEEVTESDSAAPIEPELPTSRSQIHAMRKSELQALAAFRGIDSEGKGAAVLRELLKKDIFGED